MAVIWFKRVALAAAVASAALSVSGCFPLVAGGMIAGGMSMTDRRTSGTQLEDQGIEFKASARIRDTLGERVHVNVTSYNRQVLLTGEVPTQKDKDQVVQLVSSVENVNGVKNELAIAEASSLKTRASDAIITSKVKATFVDAKDLISSAFKVTTDRGVVHLMGRVTMREKDRAAQIVPTIPGVLGVVLHFEIISEAELAGMLPQPSKPGAAPAAPVNESNN